ncbi:MAG: lipopolysaccharide biosynthesis protein [Deferrisomatales bacterium]|nr:lipopolysaccharide biosynthesis protein [Deferrisomatales bacterium]
MIPGDDRRNGTARVDLPSPETGSGAAMASEARASVRNAGLLVVQWGAQVAGAFLFAALVPRLMGPETYGRYALISSLSLWFILAGGLGIQAVISRYVPGLAGDRAGLARFFGRLFTVRVGGGFLAACLFLLLTALWFPDLDRTALFWVACAVGVQSVTRLFFSLFLGLNRAALWGMGQVVRGWTVLALLVPGYLWGGLQGACLGLLAAELVVLALGLWWARPHLAFARPRLDVWRLAPYLRFGLTVFASQLLVAGAQRSGDALVRVVSGDYQQVGFFGLAYSVYMILALAVSQVTWSFMPLFTSLLARQRPDLLCAWVERLLKGLAVAGVLAVYGLLFLGDDLVPLVFGEVYRPVGANLVPLTASLLLLALTNVGGLLALVYERPRVALKAAALQLVAFWALAPVLIAWQGGWGACLAVCIATAVDAVYFSRTVGRQAAYSLRGWWLAIAWAALFLPVLALRGSWGVNAGLFGVFVAAYYGTLRWRQVLTPGEISAVMEVIRRGMPGTKAPEPDGWA